MHPIFHILGTEISAYAALALIGLIAGLCIGEYTRRHIGLSRGGLLSFTLFCMIGAVVGAKLLFMIVEWERTVSDLKGVLFGGGFVFYGGLLMSFFTAWLWCRKTHTPMLPMLDIFFPGVTLFHAFGRVGCFLAGCCYGCETTSALGVCFPEGGYAPAEIPLMPVQLFEAAFLLILTVVLVIILKRSRISGTTFSIYLIAYAFWRFVIEFFRSDPRGSLFGLSTSQLISILLLIFGTMLYRRIRSEKEKNCICK
ncbi:MAG: prolipoprotein diacylglyceryl transferase [Christensenellaceae bacterium]|nr:prolipoprotein diacylglyceryl transferase [Christensenellaceae bacterium]